MREGLGLEAKARLPQSEESLLHQIYPLFGDIIIPVGSITGNPPGHLKEAKLGEPLGGDFGGFPLGTIHIVRGTAEVRYGNRDYLILALAAIGYNGSNGSRSQNALRYWLVTDAKGNLLPEKPTPDWSLSSTWIGSLDEEVDLAARNLRIPASAQPEVRGLSVVGERYQDQLY